MDIASHLQRFEESVSTYTGDDPLDLWDRFCEFLEKRLPAEDTKGMSLVLDRLVQKFLQDERYSNDGRYVKHCIKYASYYSEPIQLFSYIHSKGVGTRSAALYVAWAQHLEQQGLHQQADAVYRTAIESQAKPAEAVLQQYRLFQSRNSQQRAGVSDVRNPLQDTQLTNQLSSHREPGQHRKDPECRSQLPVDSTLHTIISRSENAGVIRSHQGSAASFETLSMYCKESLQCEGSEFCFEEVRAMRYFERRKQEEEQRAFEARQRSAREKEEGVQRMQRLLEELDNNLAATPPIQQGQYNTTSAHLNPGYLQQSFQQPSSLNSLSNKPSPGHSLTCALDLKSEPMRAPEPLMQSDIHLAADAQSSERSPPPCGLGLPYHPAAPPSSASPQASLQVPLVQTQPEQDPKPTELSYSAHQKTACVLEVQSGALQQLSRSHLNSSVFHMATSFQQHSGREQNVSAFEAPEAEGELDVSQGAACNLSHVTPNTSLGLVLATPSRVLPSPTVNTREALGVIMDMFQAPTLLQDEPFGSMLQAEKSFNAGYQRTGKEDTPSFNKPPAAVPFAIFQDEHENDKENCSHDAVAVDKPRLPRALVEIPVSKSEKPNETPTELIPDESTMWGVRYNSLNSLAACPNSTGEFAFSAHLASTPFQNKVPNSRDFQQDRENEPGAFGDPEENPYIRQPTKLSPILEKSDEKYDEKLSITAVGTMRAQGFAESGTIVGEGLALAQGSLAACSITEVHHASAMLSFRDQTLVHNGGIALVNGPPEALGPECDVYMSREQPPKPACLSQSSPEAALQKFQSFSIQESNFNIYISPEKAPKPAYDVPMSPECAPRPEWLVVRSPEIVTEPDLDAFMSPQQAQRAEGIVQKSMDIPMSPEPKFSMDVPMSPAQVQRSTMDVPMSPAQFQRSTMDVPMSPDQGMKVNMDIPMSPSSGTAAVGLVSNPWDEELISSLLATLSTPITTHPDCLRWQCNVPNFAPNKTIRMGEGSLRVDCLLGQGAFATVYQATDLTTSKKMVLKVQKPANPWEFYINTQLNARLQPSVRHLYNIIHSAHLFQNGSVLLGERHNCGTLLNAVNLYKNLSDKVMPQPLVIYFTICILHMVEHLHRIHIVHADIKPDNFLLGERFLENTGFDPDNLDHGLALIDLGQSIDMTLFPESTAFTAKCMTSGFQCTEMLSGRPWSYQTDYFGIAGTVYCMIFGTYMQVKNEDGVWKTNAVFRRNPHSDLWTEFFHTLLNVPDCSSLLCLGSLRSRLYSVLQESYNHNKLASLKNRLVVQLMESKSVSK